MRVLALTLTMLLIAPPALASYAEAVLDYDQGRYAEALSEFTRLAERGHASAEFMLGAMYFYGKGVVRDDAIAAIWFHKAAIKGNPNAQLAFGSLHIRGLGVKQDLVTAYKWLTIAANHAIPGLQQQAITLRDEAAGLMRPQEVQQALEEVAGWHERGSGLTAGE